MNLLLGVGLWVTVGVLLAIVIAVAIFFAIVPVNVWTKTLLSNAYIPARKLVGMKLRNVDVGLIVGCYINAKKGWC